MNKKQHIALISNTYRKVIKALNGMTNIEAVSLLEQAKLDIIFNNKLIRIDGKVGVKSGEKQ
jgi:hypothetical protein